MWEILDSVLFVIAYSIPLWLLVVLILIYGAGKKNA